MSEQYWKAVALAMQTTLLDLLDRDLTYDENKVIIPFGSHQQAIDHIEDARRRANYEFGAFRPSLSDIHDCNCNTIPHLRTCAMRGGN